jgi:amino acid adenylation domain-containing protein
MGENELTYAQLDVQSEALAKALRSRGVSRDSVVGLYIHRSLEMIVGLLGILKAGGAYLPLDPAFPAKRIEFLLDDAGVSLVLTQADLMDTLPPTAAKLLDISQAMVEGDRSSMLQLENPESADLAYLIYTSGSTGEPKGAEIPHSALVNLLWSMMREPGLQNSDTLVAVTTLSFDISGLELFGPLLCGAKLVLASREQALDPLALAELLEQSEATVLQATPSTWRMLVDSGWLGKPDLRIWCGGEALPPGLADSLLERGRELWNLYGPTETTIWSAAHRVSSGEDPILIGRPIANTKMYILDRDGEPVPIGVTGELYIAGAGVARGYRNRPELTKDRFLPDPFTADWRMYRTGDLARYRRDGQIQLLGRGDQQIKLRGHRIELGEIEAALEALSPVRQAVVTVQGQGAAQRLVAYVRPAGETPEISELRALLHERLPEYMVPGTFVFLEELPLTPNGKVDRKRLPAPQQEMRERSTEVLAPRNSIEQVIAAAWSQVLKENVVSAQDNFFDLGGHSLLLIQVLTILREKLDTSIGALDLFRYPTIRSLAAYLERQAQQTVAAGVYP